MPSFSVLAKRSAGARAKMMCHVTCEPVARLYVEAFVRPPAIVTHCFFERRLDVDERQVIEHVPNQDPTKLPNRDTPPTKLVLGPQCRTVHVEQCAVEVEEGGGS